MNKHYLTVLYDGSIFEYSKTEKEGYTPKTNTVGKVSYRKYYNSGVTGVLKGVSIRTNEHLGKREELVVTLETPTDSYILQTPLLSNKGTDMDDFAASWATVLPNMEIGKEYKVVAWRMNKGDVIEGAEVKYTKMGISVKCNNEKVPSALTYEYLKNRGTDTEELVAGDVPMLRFKKMGEKNIIDAVSQQARMMFLYDNLMHTVSTLSNSTPTTPTTPSPTPNTPVQKNIPAGGVAQNTAFDSDGDDDLPF